MTVAPECPKLEPIEPKDGKEMRRLTEAHVTFVPIGLGLALEIYIKAGYETDGASVPKSLFDDTKVNKELEKVLDEYYPNRNLKSIWEWLVGTPWDMPRLLAAIPHDALYSIKWFCRLACDKVYKTILKSVKYDAVRRTIEYKAIRIAGGKHWDAVTKEEIEKAKQLISVSVIRSSKIESRIAELKHQERGK